MGTDEIRQKTSEEQRKGMLKLCETAINCVNLDQVATKEE